MGGGILDTRDWCLLVHCLLSHTNSGHWSYLRHTLCIHFNYSLCLNCCWIKVKGGVIYVLDLIGFRNIYTLADLKIAERKTFSLTLIKNPKLGTYIYKQIILEVSHLFNCLTVGVIWRQYKINFNKRQQIVWHCIPQNKPPSYPYTLDYKIFHDCMIPPCPTKSFPGLWELPLVMWNDLKVKFYCRQS